MLIRAVRGENFMKFRKICLERIPTRGVIGIEGKNEGGKSTIGELVQFALFGKSQSSADTSVLDLIHWDQDQCAVEVDFEIPGEGCLRVWREIDRYGTNYARLLRIEANAPGSLSSHGAVGTEVASGTMQVQAELRKILRYDFDDFGRSFYLAEQEFPRSPEEMRAYLDRIVGIDSLLRVADEVQAEITSLEEEFGRVQSSIKRNTLQIEKFLPNIQRIPECEQARDEHAERLEELRGEEKKLQDDQEQTQKLIKDREAQRERLRGLKGLAADRRGESIENALRAYPDKPEANLQSSQRELRKIRERLGRVKGLVDAGGRLRSQVKEESQKLRDSLEGSGDESVRGRRRKLEEHRERVQGQRGRARILALLFLILAAAGFGFAADLQMGWTNGSLYTIAAEQLTLLTFIGAGIGVGALIFSIYLFTRVSVHGFDLQESNGRLEQLNKEEKQLREQHETLEKVTAETPDEKLPDSLGASPVEAVQQATAAYVAERDSTLSGAKDLDELFGSLADEENKVVQRLRSGGKEAKKKLQQCGEQQKREQSKRDRSESEIREYQKQDGKRLALEEQNKEIRAESDGVRNEIETRQLLLQLLQETVESVRHRTGPSLGRSLRRLLPYLTGGRYTDLKVTPDFRLQIFTSDKSDFLNPHELSGGTFEGLSLGFRLAFSQAFIRAVVHHSQFLFLDEPFKAMDPERIHKTLSVLARLSEELPQVFVVLPGIRSRDRDLYDVILTTTVGNSEMVYDGTSTSASQAKSSEPKAKASDSNVAAARVGKDTTTAVTEAAPARGKSSSAEAENAAKADATRADSPAAPSAPSNGGAPSPEASDRALSHPGSPQPVGQPGLPKSVYPQQAQQAFQDGLQKRPNPDGEASSGPEASGSAPVWERKKPLEPDPEDGQAASEA